jgi:inhibitor of cysteine peptidase
MRRIADGRSRDVAEERAGRRRTTTMAMLGGAAAVLAAAALMTGCGGSSAPESVTVDQEADQSTVTVAVDGEVVISLEENPTTGYQWMMTFGDGLKLAKDEYKPDDTSGDVTGGGGVHTWWVQVTSAGSHEVSGKYVRSWEADDPDADTYTLTIVGE